MNKDQIYSIKTAMENNEFCILENFLETSRLPTWSQLINSLNDSAHKPADFHVNDPFVETQVNYAVRRGIGYFYSFFDNKDVHVQPVLDPILAELAENDLPFIGSSVFINLVTEDEHAKPHKDAYGHSIYIQCEGTTTWRFHEPDDLDTVIGGYTLNPGDAIFFSGESWHSVYADTPRASIVIRMPHEGQ
jgi:ectoine hydroxylase-related dioxygenase (phytanoyl-CoA dioxygenase family)